MKSRVHNPKYLEKYFTQFPNIIDDSELTPYEYRLLIHYYRVGECWEGVRKTAQICKMSTGKVSICRKSLEDKGFIKVTEMNDGVIIHLVDLSAANLKKYSPESVHVVNTPQIDDVHAVNDPRSCGELKNNQSKKNPITSSNDDVTETVLIADTVNAPLVIDSKSKKARARKKANKETDECYVDFVDAWCKQYPDLGFDDVSGNKIKSMIKRTKERLIASGKEPTREAAVASFQYVLAYVKRESHWVHGKHIGVFDQHYNSVVREIKEGKQKKPANNPSSSIFGKYGHL